MDRNTGASVFRVPFTPAREDNSACAATEIGPFSSMLSGTLGGATGLFTGP